MECWKCSKILGTGDSGNLGICNACKEEMERVNYGPGLTVDNTCPHCGKVIIVELKQGG